MEWNTMADELDKNYLSYSSSTTLQACEQKFTYYKIDKIKPDSDQEQTRIHFDIGTIFHSILEDNNHELDGVSAGTLENYFNPILNPSLGNEVSWMEHGPMVIAMLRKYKEMHAVAGLRAVKCEMELRDPKFLGYVDVVMADKDDNWWIVDIKTSARFDQNIAARLPKDRQLNLYAFHKSTIAKELKLKVKNYKGCMYRVATKCKIKRKKDEAFGDYSRRLLKSVNAYQISVPAGRMDPKGVREEFDRLYDLKEEIRLGTRKPLKNTASCMNYFKPCEFWSKCHGKPFTNMWEDFSVISTE
jgi:hypothetical protein